MVELEPILDPMAGGSAFPSEALLRVAHTQRNLWVSYPAGDAILAHLQRLYDYPKTDRPPCCVLYGDTNSGKTQIALKFERDHAPVDRREDERATRSVVVVGNPPFGTVRSLYGAILLEIGAPFVKRAPGEILLEQAVTQLERLRTRILIVDETQHILAGTVDQRLIFANSLKYISNQLKIPVVAIGTLGALRALHSDPQIANRFEPMVVPRWQADQGYAQFLSRLAGQMGLANKSDFRKRELVKRVHAMTEGLTGETRKLIGLAAEQAIGSEREVIDLETLEQMPWVRPGERRSVPNLG